MTMKKMSENAINYFDLTPHISKLNKHIFFPTETVNSPFVLIQPDDKIIFKMSDCEKLSLSNLDNIIYNDVKIFILKNYYTIMDFFDKKINFNEFELQLK